MFLFKLPLTAINRILSSFRRLQWKLTLAYTLSTVVTALILAAIGLAILWYINFRSNLLPGTIAKSLNQGTSDLTSHLAQDPPDREALRDWLQSVTPNNYFTLNIPDENTEAQTDTRPVQLGRVILAAIVDEAGNIIIASPAEVTESEVLAQLVRPSRREIIAPTEVNGLNVPLQSQLSASGKDILQAALQGETDSSQISTRSPAGDLLAAAPIFGENRQVEGVVFVKLAFPIEETRFLQSVLRGLILPIVLGMAVSGTVAGVVFGFLIARSLTGRLRNLARAAEAWSQGDFSILARDTSGDELGQLTRQFNHMALQLQNLLQSHQELATLEERNRLARELHDSVKQQIFATAMQVGAARALVEQNSAAAKTNLMEAERLVHQAQQELASLIRELRPAALEGKGLAQALREYVADWSRQSQIATEVRVRGERPLPLPLEQALFRVAQEGLTNAARHSGAEKVEVELSWSEDEVLLAITDNGAGFSPAAMDGQGLGLQSMQERVEALGGRLAVESKPGAGTQVTALVKNVVQFRRGKEQWQNQLPS